MEPDRSFIRLKNGAEVKLLNDEKETVFLEAKFSKSHPAFKPIQGNAPLIRSRAGPKKKNKKGGKTFRRQGTRR